MMIFKFFSFFFRFTCNTGLRRIVLPQVFRTFFDSPFIIRSLKIRFYEIFWKSFLNVGRMIINQNKMILCHVNGEKTISGLSRRISQFCFNTKLSYLTRKTELIKYWKITDLITIFTNSTTFVGVWSQIGEIFPDFFALKRIFHHKMSSGQGELKKYAICVIIFTSNLRREHFFISVKICCLWSIC